MIRAIYTKNKYKGFQDKNGNLYDETYLDASNYGPDSSGSTFEGCYFKLSIEKNGNFAGHLKIEPFNFLDFLQDYSPKRVLKSLRDDIEINNSHKTGTRITLIKLNEAAHKNINTFKNINLQSNLGNVCVHREHEGSMMNPINIKSYSDYTEVELTLV